MLYRQVFDKISREFHGISHIIVNFTGFCRFTWNSQLSNRAKYQKPGWYCELLHLHYTNWRLKICVATTFLQFVAKRRPEDFLISSPEWVKKNLGVLTGDHIKSFFLEENVWLFCWAGLKKVSVITRWPYCQGGRKAGFHCNWLRSSCLPVVGN